MPWFSCWQPIKLRTCQVCRCLVQNRSLTMQHLHTAAWPVQAYSGTLRPWARRTCKPYSVLAQVSNSAETCPSIDRLLLTVTQRTLMLLTRWIPGSDGDSSSSARWRPRRKTQFRPSWLDWGEGYYLSPISRCASVRLRICRVHFRGDKIGVICILHHITGVGDWSQISGMDCIRCWAYDRTLDDACKDVEEIGELAMEFGAVGTVIEKVSDPIIDVVNRWFCKQKQITVWCVVFSGNVRASSDQSVPHFFQ